MTPVTAPTQAKTQAVAATRGSRATDDEILGIIDEPRVGHRREIFRGGVHPEANRRPPQNDAQTAFEFDGESGVNSKRSASSPAASDPAAPQGAEPADANEPALPDGANDLSAALDASPELRQAWDDAHAYREAFATPREAREATALVADLNRLDALFFSQRPEDHAELAHAIANLDPGAFSSLARAMTNMNGPAQRQPKDADVGLGSSPAAGIAARVEPDADGAIAGEGRRPVTQDAQDRPAPASSTSQLTRAQTEFFQATNSAAVERVLEAIESQVDRLLPREISKTARNRVVGEIYRELDGTLRANRELSRQMRQAFRSGALDAEHQRGIVSLVANRARQALPGVAKRVLDEWTTTLVSANHERRARQRSAEGRVDIAGSSGGGNDGRRPIAPRDLDYKRLSDADILNM